jgi:hypothetical protein
MWHWFQLWLRLGCRDALRLRSRLGFHRRGLRLQLGLRLRRELRSAGQQRISLRPKLRKV